MLEVLVGAIVGAVVTIIAETIHPFISSGVRRRLDAPKERITVPISVKFEDIEKLAEVKYRLVSYGTDEILSRPGISEKLKQDGIWQNENYPVALRKAADGKAELHFTIRIHKVLGTQFKMFAVPKANQDAAKLSAILEACSGEITVTHPRAASGPVWFLLNTQPFSHFHVVHTHGETIENNYIAPAPR